MDDWLQRAVRLRPQGVAIEFSDGRALTYAELRQRAASRASLHGSQAVMIFRLSCTRR
jgi:hypothetical protein